MQRLRTLYWTTTGLITLVMMFSMYMMFTAGWEHLGFPRYFRIELVIAKLAGLAVLLTPGAPARLKEWAYAGFAIVLVSASAAHANAGDPIANVVEPLGFLAVLATSNLSWHALARRRYDDGAAGSASRASVRSSSSTSTGLAM